MFCCECALVVGPQPDVKDDRTVHGRQLVGGELRWGIGFQLKVKLLVELRSDCVLSHLCLVRITAELHLNGRVALTDRPLVRDRHSVHPQNLHQQVRLVGYHIAQLSRLFEFWEIVDRYFCLKSTNCRFFQQLDFLVTEPAARLRARDHPVGRRAPATDVAVFVDAAQRDSRCPNHSRDGGQDGRFIELQVQQIVVQVC